MSIAKTIAAQLGQKALFMMGAKNLMAGEDYLSFRIGQNSARVNCIRIRLNGCDLYDIDFIQIRGIKITIKHRFADIFAADMRRIISETTGLRLSLRRASNE